MTIFQLDNTKHTLITGKSKFQEYQPAFQKMGIACSWGNDDRQLVKKVRAIGAKGLMIRIAEYELWIMNFESDDSSAYYFPDVSDSW